MIGLPDTEPSCALRESSEGNCPSFANASELSIRGTDSWVVSGWSTDAEPTAYVSYTGFLMGLVVAFPLEAKRIDFDPRSGAVWMKALRFIIAIVLVMGTLLILDEISEALATDYSPLGYVLRYIRYALAGVAGILLGPLVFVKLGLAERRRSR